MDIYIKKFPVIGYISVYTERSHIIRIKFGKDKNIAHKNICRNYSPIIDNLFNMIKRYVSGDKVDFNVPFKVNSTPFFSAVYKHLKRIPYGTVISYKDLAILTGSKNAARAVGNACRNNPVPLIIPCHRVVNSNGFLGGFAGGKELKKKLLLIEDIKIKGE
jgi:methylated-DNA-[protein]-cysteine S-methyltransferase